MTDFTQEIKHLQKLSCISLSPQEEQKFGTQLRDIIDLLGKLPKTSRDTLGSIRQNEEKLTLRTVAGTKAEEDAEKILRNVKHEMINNSIVIKSALN